MHFSTSSRKEEEWENANADDSESVGFIRDLDQQGVLLCHYCCSAESVETSY